MKKNDWKRVWKHFEKNADIDAGWGGHNGQSRTLREKIAYVSGVWFTNNEWRNFNRRFNTWFWTEFRCITLIDGLSWKAQKKHIEFMVNKMMSERDGK